jgi:adenylate kinase
MPKLGFNIVLLGMITSGKDTQAKILKKKYSLQLVESGIYWRKLIKEKSKDGAWVRRTTGKGHPAPVALMKKFLIKEIYQKPKNKDLLFLGNPRLKPEAQLLKKLFEKQKEDFIAFYITLPDKEVYRRSQIRQKSKVGQAYKIFDNKKNIATRIKWHKNQVGKTVKYLEGLKKLKKINGNRPVQKVAQDIEKIIKTYQKNQK